MSRRAALALAAASALLGALVAAAALRAPGTSRGRDAQHAGAAQAGAGAGAAEAADAPAASEPAAAGSRTIELDRHAVCEREETRAALSQVALVRDRPALWSLHCGRSVHLLALAPLADSLVPVRVAVVHAASASLAETALALDTVAADVNGDGRADWVVPVSFVDATGVPRGGGVHALQQRAEGGFSAPRRLLAAAPGAVAVAQLDGEPADDLVVLHRADASTARSDELWLLAGGPSPLRIAQLPAAVATRAVAALDLDADRRDDLIAASSGEGGVLLWLSGGGALAQAQRSELALPGVEHLFTADVDHDGVRELVLAGERASLLAAPLGASPSPVTIAGSDGLRDVHFADSDGDGRPELVGYAHPDLIALRPTGERRFARTHLVSLRGDASVLFARIAQLDGDPRPDLVVLVLAEGSGAHVELALARNLEPPAIVQLGQRSAPVADAALLQRFTLP